MTQLLYIESSPHGAASHSGAAARAFLHAYTGRHPRADVDHIDVWNLDLPPFDAEMIAAKFAVLRAQEATPAQQARWDEAVQLARRFNRADLYLFSLPMWNFGLPYRLKHFIDVVTLPGQNWRWSRETGYRPLLADKRAVLVYSSAGIYPQDTVAGIPNLDYQKAYMRQWLRFLGIDLAGEIEIAPTLSSPEMLGALRESAATLARDLAVQF
jgi:FMN-dependent NADH-azoreductase